MSNERGVFMKKSIEDWLKSAGKAHDMTWKAATSVRDAHYQTLLAAKDAEIAECRAAVTRNLIKVSALTDENAALKRCLSRRRRL